MREENEKSILRLRISISKKTKQTILVYVNKVHL